MLIGRLLACGANWWTKGQVGLWSRWLLTDGARAGEESNQVEAVIWLPSGGCESGMMSEWVSAPPDRLMSVSCHGGLPLPQPTTKSWRQWTVNRWQELVNRSNQTLPISTQQPTVMCSDYEYVWIISPPKIYKIRNCFLYKEIKMNFFLDFLDFSFTVWHYFQQFTTPIPENSSL